MKKVVYFLFGLVFVLVLSSCMSVSMPSKIGSPTVALVEKDFVVVKRIYAESTDRDSGLILLYKKADELQADDVINITSDYSSNGFSSSYIYTGIAVKYKN